MLGFLARLVWPGNFSGFLARLVGAASLLAILHKAYELGIGPAILTLIAYYDRLVDMLVGSWADPVARWLLENLRALLDWHLQLHGHWRHVFVLMCLYFVRNGLRITVGGLLATGAVLTTLGVGSALAFSLLAGCVDPAGPRDFWANLLIGLSPVGAFLVYEIGLILWLGTFRRAHEDRASGHAETRSWAVYVTELLLHVFRQCLVASLIVAVAVLVFGLIGVEMPGLAAIGVLALVMALHWLQMGAGWANHRGGSGEDWRDAFLSEPATKVGMGILSVMFWVLVLVLTNAGLSTYGL